MAPSMSLRATPGSAIWRTIASRRGSNTVALMRPAPNDFRTRAYSVPHSAAGRPAKLCMVARPSTRILVGRTGAAATSRSVAPISMPTPEPNASSLRRSLEMGIWKGMAGAIAPSRVVPPQDVGRGIVSHRQVPHLRPHRAPEGREVSVVEPQPRRGAQGDDRVAFHPQAVRADADGLQEVIQLLLRKWRVAPVLHQCLDGEGSEANGSQDCRSGGIGVHLLRRAENREAVRQPGPRSKARPSSQLRVRHRNVGPVKDIWRNAFHKK